MHLMSLGATISAPGGRTGSIISFLPDFTSLTSLRIQNFRGYSNYPEFSIFSVLRSCQNLISFQIENEFDEPECGTDYRFDHSKLRRLDITVPEITKQHIDYITSNITQLDQLYLKTCAKPCGSEPLEPIEWLKEIGADNLERLQKYLASIETVEFEINEMFQSTFTEQWGFIKGVLSEKPASTAHITMMIDDYNENFESEVVCMKKNGNYISFYCAMDIIEFIEFSKSKSSVQPTFIPPDMTDYNVKSFNVSFITGDPKEASKILALRSSIFRSIVKFLPNLDYLNMRIDILTKTIYQIKLLSNDSLDPATNYRIDHFTKTANRRSIIPPGKLDYVLLKYMRSTKEIDSILNLLPDTIYLNLFGCKIDQNDNGNLALDLGNLRLQRLVSDNPQIKQINRNTDEPNIVYRSEEEKTNIVWKEEDIDYD